jgi:protein-L-isoaspartate(D-aspartate) O-methyltransferase
LGIDYTQARRRMVVDQLQSRDIRDRRILDAFLEMPRHLFVESALAAQVYSDRAIPIGYGQTISQPYMVGAMTQALAPGAGDKLLEIGTGSGYQAAILSRLARSVFTVERIAPLAQRAKQVFTELKIDNIIQKVGDGSLGWKTYAPYDGIIVTAGGPEVPESLLTQLSDGGRLVIPTGSRNRQELTIVTRTGESYQTERGISCIFVPLIGEEGWIDD